MADAVRWAQSSVRPDHGGCPPSLPFIASLEDHLESGWGLPERADDPSDDEDVEPYVSAERAQFYEAALQWQAKYLIDATDIVPGRALSAWLRSQVYRRQGEFEARARKLGLGKSQAYRLRDRALGIIALGLTRDGVPTDE